MSASGSPDRGTTDENQIIAQRIIEVARAGVRDPVDLCAMAIKDLMGPTVLNPGLHSRSVSSAPF
jgi:hypothetical protein